MLKRSVLLDYIMYGANEMRIADGLNGVSENYFFASLLQVLVDRAANKLPEIISDDASLQELAELELLVQKYNFNFERARDGILGAVRGDGYNPESDVTALAQVYYDAEIKAEACGKDFVDACSFVKLILDAPTDTIKEYVISSGSAEDAKDVQDKKSKSVPDIEKMKASFFAQAAKNSESPPDKSKASDTLIFESPEIPDEKPKAPVDSAPAEKPMDMAEKTNPGIERLAKTVEDTKNIQKLLLDSVFGQDQAINLFVSGYFQSELMAHSRKGTVKPQATFLFAGPPGVGKTFLAEKAAEALKRPFMRFDMSEYSDEESVFQFCGIGPSYKNAKMGNVTEFVHDNPQCVLLFDEIEKSHINIIHLFLQILDAGRVRDNFTDEEISFSSAVIIFTTNAGKNLYADTSITNLSALPRKQILKALEKDTNPETKLPLFPAAICSRFASGNVVMFNYLDANNLFTIAKRELNNNISGFKESTGISIQLADTVPTAIILSEGGKADARTVKGRSNAFFHEELYELFRLLATETDIIRKINTIKVNISLDDANPEISKMFINPKKPEILIFADPKKIEPAVSGFGDVTVHIADKIDQAKELLFNHDISVILCDIYCNPRTSNERLLNVEDISSDGRDFLVYAISRYSVPVHLIQSENGEISQEEFLSFTKLGVQDILALKNGDNNDFEKQVVEKCNIAYQQSNMLKLARENKVITYKTSQTISQSNETAEISLFDFKLTLATDVEDSKNILDNISKPNVRFSDVIGAEDAKKELTYFVEYLKDPIKYIRKGVRAPKGVLLYGPPGTGKTMLAKAMAGESDVTFITAEGNQFLKKYIGEGAEAVHNLFAAARKYAPSILFIDEIDAIGKNRNLESAEHTSNILTAFLTEMDGFNTDTAKPVFVLAATNYEIEEGKGKSLDQALLRRFDRRIYVDLPTKEERKRFLCMKVKNNAMISLSDEQIENIALRSTGMSLAALDSVYEMALRNAIRSKDCIVDDAAFEEAFETFNSGEKKHWNTDTLVRTARHESGHALLCWLSGETPPYVTIVARGDHGGYMQHAENEGKALYTRAELLAKIRVSLAGRAAELVYYGNESGVSTGASGDLHNATVMAQQMICNFGMDEQIGLSYIDGCNSSSAYYGRIHDRTNEILSAELKNTIKIIFENKAAIDKMVQVLLDKNHLKGKEIDEIFRSTVNN